MNKGVAVMVAILIIYAGISVTSGFSRQDVTSGILRQDDAKNVASVPTVVAFPLGEIVEVKLNSEQVCILKVLYGGTAHMTYVVRRTYVRSEYVNDNLVWTMPYYEEDRFYHYELRMPNTEPTSIE